MPLPCSPNTFTHFPLRHPPLPDEVAGAPGVDRQREERPRGAGVECFKGPTARDGYFLVTIRLNRGCLGNGLETFRLGFQPCRLGGGGARPRYSAEEPRRPGVDACLRAAVVDVTVGPHCTLGTCARFAALDKLDIASDPEEVSAREKHEVGRARVRERAREGAPLHPKDPGVECSRIDDLAATTVSKDDGSRSCMLLCRGDYSTEHAGSEQALDRGSCFVSNARDQLEEPVEGDRAIDVARQRIEQALVAGKIRQ